MRIKVKWKDVRMGKFKMNQKEFADFLEENYKQYNHYEVGRQYPKLPKLLKLLKKTDEKLENVYELID